MTEFYKLKRPRDAAQIMTDLINLLEDLQTQPSKTPEDGALTSAQISGTLYLTRLALARLYLIYCDQGLLELSRGIFLKAIHSKWRIDEQKLNETASVRRSFDLATMQSHHLSSRTHNICSRNVGISTTY
jgi:hypothetical protein